MSDTPENISMQAALNRALSDALADDPSVLVLGEDVGKLGGVFRVTDGLQQRFGESRVFDTPLAEAGIMGLSVGLAMNGFKPVPEIQFDGFSYPAMNQIITQLARMNYRTRGAFPMPVTLRLPSFGGIRSPELHGESLESIFAHVPGLKVVSPSTPSEAYALLRQSIADPDPVIFMEPKSRYWNKKPFDPEIADERLPVGSSRVVRAGKHATLIAWGAMVSRCLDVAQFAEEDGVDLEVLDMRWLKPLDTRGLTASVRKTKRAIVVHEAPRTVGLGAEISALVTESAFDVLKAPVARVTGYDVPYPAGRLEDEYIPSIDRIMTAVQDVFSYRRDAAK
ncbi:MAG: alpha-ketoacid dehydrogenase subunit beta [Nakamurella sp.]